MVFAISPYNKSKEKLNIENQIDVVKGFSQNNSK